MGTQIASDRSLRIMLAVMSQSPFNRSIWTGIHDGFSSLGHDVRVVDATGIPDPNGTGGDPDFLFVVHGFNVPVEKVRAYGEAGITTAVYLLDEPYEVDRSVEWARYYDWIFSVDRATVPLHRQYAQAGFLPLAYNDAVFSPEGPAVPSRILVLGTPFGAREPYLEILRDRWGKLVTWVGPGWKQFSSAGVHYEHYVSPGDCARFYRGSDIVINIHRDSTWSHFGELNKAGIEATHLNPRFWEAAACKGLQLCSYRSDLDAFAPRCPTFRTVDEFATRVDYLLGSPGTRADTAKRVYNKIRNHTYKASCMFVLETLAGRVF